MSTKCVWRWYSHSSHIFLMKMLHFLLSGEHPFSHASFTSGLEVSLLFLFPNAMFGKNRLANKQAQTAAFEVHVIHGYHPLPLAVTNISSFIKWWFNQYLLYYLATHSPGGRLQGEWPIEHSRFSYSLFLYYQKSYLIYRFPWHILILEPR